MPNGELIDIEALRSTRRMLDDLGQAVDTGAIEETARIKALMEAGPRVRATILEMEIATRQDEFIGRTAEMVEAVISGAITDEQVQAMIDDPTAWGAGSSDARVREAVLKAALELARFAI